MEAHIKEIFSIAWESSSLLLIYTLMCKVLNRNSEAQYSMAQYSIARALDE